VRTAGFLLVVPLLVQAQSLELGIRGGVPVSESFIVNTEFHIGFGETARSATRRYIVGPMLRVNLPHRFGIEADALYHRLRFDNLTEHADVFNDARIIAHSWEIPVTASYRVAHGLEVLAGPAFRTSSENSRSATETFPGQTFPIPATGLNSTISRRSSRGITAGVGISLRTGPIHLHPEARYTRWGTDAQEDPFLYSNPNQLELTLGVTFGR